VFKTYRGDVTQTMGNSDSKDTRSGPAFLKNRPLLNIYVGELDELDDAGKPTGEHCFYVGRTTKPHEVRWAEHMAGHGAMWCKRHRPRRLVEKAIGSQFVELALTLEYMHHMGIDKVRGATYCKVVMPAHEKAEIKRHLDAANFALKAHQKATHSSEPTTDGTQEVKKVLKCGICRQPGHNRTNCPTLGAAPSPTTRMKRGHCSLCGLAGHNKTVCSSTVSPYICHRCGRYGHGFASCNATIYPNGDPIL